MDLIEVSKYFRAEETKSRWCCSGVIIAVYSHVRRVYDYVQCSLTPITSSLPPTATMHQRRYIVRLTSRHFKGYNFPAARTKYVIAIRARNTFLLQPPLPTSSSYVFVLPRCRRYSPSLYGPQSAARVLSEISFSCAMGTATRLSTNSPAGRYLINLWRRREFLVAHTDATATREEFSRIFCAATVLL